MVKMECEACGEDCSNAYMTFRGAPYHFSCIPMRNALRSRKTAFDKACKAERDLVEKNNNPIYDDDEAMKALQTLKDKGYSSEDVIQKLWEMEMESTTATN